MEFISCTDEKIINKDMWGVKLLTAVLIASSMTLGALWEKAPSPKGVPTSNIEKYVYPGAQVVNAQENNYVMVASASLEEATDWYNKTFDANKLKDKNVIRSDANGDKVNLLTGNGLPGEIDVAIKEEGNGIVSIAVTNDTSDLQQI